MSVGISNMIVKKVGASQTMDLTPTYYVKSDGNDGNTGLSDAQAWQTITRVNTALASITAGQNICFRRGDVFYGTLNFPLGGSSGSPVGIGAYGTGANPVITGLTTITGWSFYGGNIYSKVISCDSAPNVLLLDGVQKAKGRWPNSGWYMNTSVSGDTSLTDTVHLDSGVINWTGAKLVQRKACQYVVDEYVINSHSGSTLSYSGVGTYPPGTGWGYFIEDDLKTLTYNGAWYYNTGTSTLYVYFGDDSPDDHTVQLSTLDYGAIFTTYRHYILFQNIEFHGVNKDGIYIYHNDHITTNSCTFYYCGLRAIFGDTVTYLTVNRCTIGYSGNRGVWTTGYSSNHNTVSYCTIHDIGFLGIFEYRSSMYTLGGNGITLGQGGNNIYEYNVVYNSAFNGILLSGSDTIVRNNFISNFCLIKADGGGVYYGSQTYCTNMQILDNIVINGYNPTDGCPVPTTQLVRGIYLDYNTTGGVEILRNIVSNIPQHGIFIYGDENVIIEYNLVYNCAYCVTLDDCPSPAKINENITLKYNAIIARESTQYAFLVRVATDTFTEMGDFDYNIYARPIDDTTMIFPVIGGSGTPKTLAQWQTMSDQDPNSLDSPYAVISVDDLLFYYNENNYNKTIVLPAGNYKDVYDNSYSGSFSLSPWTGVVLMKIS